MPSRAEIDEVATIDIDGGAVITMFAVDSDCTLIRNCMNGGGSSCSPYVVSGVPPAPSAFDGQFFHMNVVSVSVR